MNAKIINLADRRTALKSHALEFSVIVHDDGQSVLHGVGAKQWTADHYNEIARRLVMVASSIHKGLAELEDGVDLGSVVADVQLMSTGKIAVWSYGELSTPAERAWLCRQLSAAVKIIKGMKKP